MLRWTTTAVLAVLVLVASLASPAAANGHGNPAVGGKATKCQPGERPDARGKCAQAVKPDKTEQAKSMCTTDLCQNGGVCFEMRGFALCNCTGTKFTGRTCEKNKARVDREKAERQEVQGALAKMEQVKKEWKDKTDKCSAKDKRHVCPGDVGPKADQCVASMTDCWVDGLVCHSGLRVLEFVRVMSDVMCNSCAVSRLCNSCCGNCTQGGLTRVACCRASSTRP